MARNKNIAKTDDDILAERISANQLVYPKRSLVFVAMLVSFQAVYFSHAINGMEWTKPLNLLLYALVTGVTTYMLSQAYVVMVESEFWSRQRHFTEVQANDEGVLRTLRLQVAIGRTLFFLNGFFFVFCAALMGYFFRQTDPMANYVLSPTLVAALLWLIAQKNEESRQRRMKTHK